jgi:hypothetical protein
MELKPHPYITAVNPNTVLYCNWRFGMAPYEQFISFYPDPIPDVSFLPSHILPHYYYNRLLWDGQYQLNMFGSTIENQMNWLELGQMWTLKPAVLKTAYR